MYGYNNLISCIYDLELGHADWDLFLDLVYSTFPECLVMLSVHDLSRAQTIVFAQRGLSPVAETAYVRTFAAINPWAQAHTRVAPYQVFHDDHLVPRTTALATEFYSEWLGRQGAYQAGSGVVLIRQGTRQLVLELRYPAALENELRERATVVLGDAACHFRRAFERRAMHPLTAGKSYLDNLVEDMPLAVFFVNSAMRVVYCNTHADAMRRSATSPFIADPSAFRAKDEETDSLLSGLVHKVVSQSRTQTVIVQISGPNRSRYFAIGRRAVSGRDASHHHHIHDALFNPDPLAMLVVHGQMEMSSLATADLLWSTFNLTAAEAQLAQALLMGRTLAEYAQARLVSKQTVRNQLVGIMRKTGTKRQPELVSLLTQLVLVCP